MTAFTWNATSTRNASTAGNYKIAGTTATRVPSAILGDTVQDASSGSPPTSGSVSAASWDINGGTYNASGSAVTYNCAMIDSAGTGTFNTAGGDSYMDSITVLGANPLYSAANMSCLYRHKNRLGILP